MPSTVRRSQELQKKLQRRNNSLKPADFTKDQTVVSHVEKKIDPVEKSKAALSDLRKRIDERKRLSKLVDVQQYQERREEPIPELTGATFSESPISERQEPSPNDETLPQTIGRSSPNLKQTLPRRNIAIQNTSLEKVSSRATMQHHKGQNHHQNDVSNGRNINTFEEVLPSQIEVRSNEVLNSGNDDDNSEVSEITTDVRIMSTKGASYAEHRMTGKLKMKLARPSLSTPLGRRLEKDVNISVSNLRHLGKAVEQAKMDLRKEMSPTNDTARRHGLPYEDTDYRPSVDEDEVDSWGDAIRTDFQEQRNAMNTHVYDEEKNKQFIADKSAAKKLQKLVKEAYSYEGDVFIDATEIREEDLDCEYPTVPDEGNNHGTPIKLDDPTADTSVLLGDKILTSKGSGSGDRKGRNESARQYLEIERNDLHQEDDVSDHESDATDYESDGHKTLEDETGKNEFSFSNDPKTIASDLYKSSLGFFKSFSNQVDTQLKAIQERGLISKSDMDGMLGVLGHDVNETKSNLPKDSDDMVIFLGDEFEASACGTNSENMRTNPDPVEKMLESLKKSYKTGISKCGIDSDLIKENTKAIEDMVSKLKQAKESDQDNGVSGVTASSVRPESLSGDKVDGNLLKELSAEGVEDMVKEPIPLTTSKEGNRTFIVSVNMPKNV